MRLFALIDDTVDNLDRPFYFGGPFDREWYHTFPTLGRGPESMEFVEETLFDPTLRTEYEFGPPLTRSRTTSAPKVWNVVLTDLSNANKVTLDSFQRNIVNFGAEEFKWTNMQDGTTYRVRFFAPIRFTIQTKDPRLPPNRWRIEFKLYTN